MAGRTPVELPRLLRFSKGRALNFVAAAVSALALAGCNQTFEVRVDGSSTVFPISEVAADRYGQSQAARLIVNVSESGTGGGFKKFCRGEVQVVGASRPILKGEMNACAKSGVRFIELPIAYDALSVVVHPDSPLTSITVEQLKAIWAPKPPLCTSEDLGADGRPKKPGACLTAAEEAAWKPITNWRQVDQTYPDMAIGLYGPGTASGTFDYFTEAIVGKSKASRTDYTPSEDDNVLVQGITSDRGGLGYFGMSYYNANKTRVRALAISYKGGPAIYPTAETVQSGQYRPLSRPLFIYVSAQALEMPPVSAFVNFYLDNAPALAEHVGFVPLPDRAYAIGKDRVARRLTGTGFAGVQDVTGNIEDVLSRPLVDAPSEPPRAANEAAPQPKPL